MDAGPNVYADGGTGAAVLNRSVRREVGLSSICLHVCMSASNAIETMVVHHGQEPSFIGRRFAAAVETDYGSFPGPRTRQALMVLVDMSAFLYSPVEEMPAVAKPDPVAQREMSSSPSPCIQSEDTVQPSFTAAAGRSCMREQFNLGRRG
jgi:hypothetical protein